MKRPRLSLKKNLKKKGKFLDKIEGLNIFSISSIIKLF